jgi:hypothetical protein
VRVPWFVQWKGHIPAGKVDDRPVIQLDILPTALAAAGVTPQPEWKMEGVNLLPYLTGEKSNAPHDALYWRFGQQIAIRKGDWKLVKGAGENLPRGAAGGAATTEGAQLFNLTKDIGEKTNLAEKEPEKVKELAAAWNEWNKGNIPAKWTPGARAKRVNQSATTSTATTSPKGPWKSGDSLAGNAAPQVGGHGFQISARIDSAAPKGVILAQGGGAHGYALYVHDGKLALAVRVQRELTVITSNKSLEPGKHEVSAQLAADGKVTLSVDGETIGDGKASFISKQPAEGLNVGGDGKNAVGEYEAPNEFAGKVENATVSIL